MDAGRQCLRLNLPLFVAEYSGMPPEAEGNRILIKEGALRLLKSRSTNRANLGELYRALSSETFHPMPAESRVLFSQEHPETTG
jgi:hypothetical protein